MIKTKSTENTKVIIEPRNKAVPSNIDSIPRYIGCLLSRNGPDVIKVVGSICGFTVVFIFFNNESVHRFNTIPKTISINPLYVIGAERMVLIGIKKWLSIESTKSIIKYVGGMIFGFIGIHK